MRLISCLAILFVFLSCKNDKSEEILESIKAKTVAEYYFLDTYREVLDLVPAFVANGKSADSLVQITTEDDFSTPTYPKKIKINYGSISKADENGINRRGSIIVSIESNEILRGAFTVEYEYFYLNETRMLGTIMSDYTENSGKPIYTLSLRDSSKCMNANGTMSFSGSLLLQQVAGETTISIFDDVFDYEEKTKGQDFNGVAYESKSTDATRLDFSCKYILFRGRGEFLPNNLSKQIYTYANACSGIVEVEMSDDFPLFFQLK